MNRIPQTAKRYWRSAAGFAIIGIAVLGYLLAPITGQGLFYEFRMNVEMNVEWVTLFNLLILQATIICFAVYTRQRLPDYIRRNLHFTILFAANLLLTRAGFTIMVIATHFILGCIQRISPEIKEAQHQSNGKYALLHLTAGLLTQSIRAPDIPLLDNLVFFPNLIFALACYIFVYHILCYGLQKAKSLALDGSTTSVKEIRPILTARIVFMSLGYVMAVLWQTHSWLIFIGLVPIVYILLQIPFTTANFTSNSNINSNINPNIDPSQKHRHMLSREDFERLFKVEFERAQSNHRPLTLLMADVDNVRHINNVHGYITGDRVLRDVVEQIQDHFYDLPSQSLLGHWQGKTYVIALSELDESQVRATAEQLCGRVNQHAFTISVQSQSIRATLSLGYAHIQPTTSNTRELIETARQALTLAKMTGKNRVLSAAELPHSAKAQRILGTPLNPAPHFPTPSNRVAPVAPPIQPIQPIGPAPSTPTQTRVTDHQPKPAPRSFSPNQIKLIAYISIVVILGGMVAALGWINTPIDWTRVLLLAGLAVLAQFLQVELYGSSSMSVAVAISFGSLVMDGIPGAIISSAAIALTHRARETRSIDFSTIYKTLFNWSVHALSSFLPVYFARLIKLDIHASHPTTLIGFAILASMQIFVVESSLMAIAIGLSQSRPPYKIWQEQYRWLLGHYITLCLLGLFLAIGYGRLGVLGLVAFALPVAMMHFSQRQYVARTAASLRELRRMNEEISVANEEIKTANHSIGQLNNELFLTLSKIIDARDPFALDHASKVAQYATAIAERMNLSTGQRELIWQVSLLHDIGKLGIPENVLQKPGPLTSDEYELLKTHSQLGADLLETSHGLSHLAPYVKTHHENWAGNGYPDNIRGEAIPLETRIITLADAVDAMASDRPYHKGLKPAMVITEVIRCRGEQFDPAVVDAFMQLIAQFGEGYITNSVSQVQIVPNDKKSGLMRATAWPLFVNASSSTGRLEVTKRG